MQSQERIRRIGAGVRQRKADCQVVRVQLVGVLRGVSLSVLET
jgi:hypothetical protein